jgi:signal transduction histidine kinase
VLRSVRFRLAMLYTVALVGVAGVLVVGLNLALDEVLAMAGRTSSTSLESQLFQLFGLPDLLGVDQAILDAERQVREAALAGFRTLSVAGLVVLVPVGFGIGWAVAGRVTRPVGRITAVARDIEATDLSRRIHLDGPPDELRDLADTFDGMLDRLDRGVRAQRTFIEDTSHELRNPLAVIRTTLDVALAEPDDAAGLRRAAEVALRTAEGMSTTVDELLSFVRTGAGEQRRVPVDLAEVVADVAGAYEANAAVREVRVEWAAPDGVVVTGDRDALKRAAANLVSNAVRVAPAGSVVHVRAGRIPGWCWFGVRDAGPGIDPNDQPLVFARAWRDGRSVAAGSGRGIGLAVVRQIAEAHGGTASVASRPGEGASFVVWLPDRDDATGIGRDLSTATAAVADLRRQPDPLWAVGTAS